MKKHITPKRTTVPTSGPQAFATLQSEIAAVTDLELVPISVDIPYAHQIAFAAADRIDNLIPELEQLPFFDIDRVLKIRMYAAACQHAHLLATSPGQTDPRLAALLEEGTKLREDLLSTAELLAHFGEVSVERVAAIRSGTGYIDMANDIEQLGVLFEEIWENVESRVPVTAEMVERAPTLAHQLHVALGVKRTGGIVPDDDPQRTRQRAYTLFARAYEECRRGVSFVRSTQGDAEVFAPSIYVKQRRRSPSAVTDEPETEAPEPVPPANLTSGALPVRSPVRTPLTELEPSG